MRWIAAASAGMMLGLLMGYQIFVGMPQHRIDLAIEACTVDAEMHHVSQLAWAVWGVNPEKYPIQGPAFVTSRMDHHGAMQAVCMAQQLGKLTDGQ